MKLFFLAPFILFATLTSFAQVKMIAPLPCNTWGNDQFLSYEEIDGMMPKQKEPGKHKYMSYNYQSEDNYNSYPSKNKIYSWNLDRGYEYINNIQVIRWIIQENTSFYKISVLNIYDELLYEIENDNTCGIIIFPDSVSTNSEKQVIIIEIKPRSSDNKLLMNNFSKIFIEPSPQKLSILKEIQGCTTLECKIEVFKLYKKNLDILSLLELEKMRDPQNKQIDKLYWKFISEIMYNVCGLPDER